MLADRDRGRGAGKQRIAAAANRDARDLEVVGSEPLFADGQRRPIEPLGEVELALRAKEDAEAVQAIGDVRIVLAQDRNANLQGTHVKGPCGVEVPFLMQHAAQVAQAGGHLDVVGA